MAIILTDSRAYARVKVDFRVEWGATRRCEHSGDNVIVLSSTGCFIRTTREARKGETIFLRLWDSPGGGAILESKVRYVLRFSLGQSAVGFGVDFIGLSADLKDHLEHLLEFFREDEQPGPPPTPFDSRDPVPEPSSATAT